LLLFSGSQGLIQGLLDLPELQRWVLILLLLIGLIWAIRFWHRRAYRLKKFEHARNTDASPDFLQGGESRRRAIRQAGTSFDNRNDETLARQKQSRTSRRLLIWLPLVLACLALAGFFNYTQRQTEQENKALDIDIDNPVKSEGSEDTREKACEKFPGLC